MDGLGNAPAGLPLVGVLLVAALVLVGLIRLALRLRRGRIPPVPYRRAAALLSPAELQFLAALDAALGGNYRVFAKVRVADLAEVLPGLSPSARQAALNRVAQKHFDFVVCSVHSGEVLCAAELNDSSHSTSRARKRDQFVAKVCEAIGLPLVTFPAARRYDPEEIRRRMGEVLAGDGGGRSQWA
jgi:hypothetical protein